MPSSAKTGNLQKIPTAKIKPNEENPRLIFRAEELEELADSIQDIGVQVPISVFKDGTIFKLIDGERRWRACRMINRATIPAILYPKPDQVKNIVYMFNIHRFRRDWDPLPTAIKLQELRDLINNREGVVATESQLAALTGMSRGAIRRCNVIMEIPAADRKRILKELRKPEKDRRFTTDLYIETQRSVRTVRRYVPDLKYLEKQLRESLIRKYEQGVIVNVVHMRMVAKIARAATKGASPRVVERLLVGLANKPGLGVEEAYGQIAWVYDLRAIFNQAKSLKTLISSLPQGKGVLNADTRTLLRDLLDRISSLVE